MRGGSVALQGGGRCYILHLFAIAWLASAVRRSRLTVLSSRSAL
jgi:hypothetical protein